MTRLLAVLTVVLGCLAGGGLVTVAAGPVLHGAPAALSTAMPARPRPSTPPSSTTPTPAAATVSAGPDPAVPDPATLAADVRQAMLAVLPGAQTGFEVFDRSTGAVLTSGDPDRQFPAMSVVKLLIALDVLAQHPGTGPDATTLDQLHRMLADSDDAVADTLWEDDGGPAVVTRMVALLGLTGTQPPADPSEWGDTLITATDMVTVYRYITDQLPQPARDLLLGALADAPTTAADGFDQYFGIPSGLPRATWAIKQGWGTSGAEAVMNSTGLVGADQRYVVVLLSSAPADSYLTLPAVDTAGAAGLASTLGFTAP